MNAKKRDDEPFVKDPYQEVSHDDSDWDFSGLMQEDDLEDSIDMASANERSEASVEAAADTEPSSSMRDDEVLSDHDADDQVPEDDDEQDVSEELERMSTEGVEPVEAEEVPAPEVSGSDSEAASPTSDEPEALTSSEDNEPETALTEMSASPAVESANVTTNPAEASQANAIEGASFGIDTEESPKAEETEEDQSAKPDSQAGGSESTEASEKKAATAEFESNKAQKAADLEKSLQALILMLQEMMQRQQQERSKLDATLERLLEMGAKQPTAEGAGSGVAVSASPGLGNAKNGISSLVSGSMTLFGGAASLVGWAGKTLGDSLKNRFRASDPSVAPAAGMSFKGSPYNDDQGSGGAAESASEPLADPEGAWAAFRDRYQTYETQMQRESGELLRLASLYQAMSDEARRESGGVYEKVIDRAEVSGISEPDVIREMRPGGQAEDLFGEYSEYVDATPQASLHRQMMKDFLKGYAEKSNQFADRYEQFYRVYQAQKQGIEDAEIVALSEDDIDDRITKLSQDGNEATAQVSRAIEEVMPVRDESAARLEKSEFGQMLRLAPPEESYSGDHPEIYERIRAAKYMEMAYQDSVSSLKTMMKARSDEEPGNQDLAKEVEATKAQANALLDNWMNAHEQIQMDLARAQAQDRNWDELDELRQFQGKSAKRMEKLTQQHAETTNDPSHRDRMNAFMEKMKALLEAIKRFFSRNREAEELSAEP